MRDSSLSRLAALALISTAAGCDSGESSVPTGDSTSNTVNTVSTSATVSNTVSTTTSTSTTGGGTGGGLEYTTGMGCTPGAMTTTGVLNGRYDKLKFAVDSHEYFLQVNQWNEQAAGDQKVSYGGSSFFRMTTQTASAPTDGGPTGFPSLFIGGNSNNVTNGSNLPKQVSTLTAVPTKWVWNDAGTLANGSANSYNAAYDVWFSQGADGEPSAYHPSGAFLMVWYHKPSDAQPVGGVREQNATVPGIPGTWNIWEGVNQNTPIISYVATATIRSMDFDLNDFIQHAVARGGSVQSSHYLTNVFVGFEIWRGGVNLETTSFCAEVL